MTMLGMACRAWHCRNIAVCTCGKCDVHCWCRNIGSRVEKPLTGVRDMETPHIKAQEEVNRGTTLHGYQ